MGFATFTPPGRCSFHGSVRLSCIATTLIATLTGCMARGAPSFVIAGSFFPGWMLCAVLGIIAAIGIRAVFVLSGLAGVLPLQLFVCVSIGLSCGVFAWLICFGQ